MTWKKLFIAFTALWAAIAVHCLAVHSEYRLQPTIVVDTELLASVSDHYQGGMDDVEGDENQLIEEALLRKANRLENCTVTAYCPCSKCCGKSDGITASGRKVTPGVSVAVDPALIPLGSEVMIEKDGELIYCRADDTGGSITGSHIDLAFASHDEALHWGRQKLTVYWIAPEMEDKN